MLNMLHLKMMASEFGISYFRVTFQVFFPNLCDIIPQTKSLTRLPTQVNPPVLGEGRISDVASKVLLPRPFKPECRGENELYFETLWELASTGEHGFFAILLMVQKSGDHQLSLVVYLILYRVLYIPGGASTVLLAKMIFFPQLLVWRDPFSNWLVTCVTTSDSENWAATTTTTTTTTNNKKLYPPEVLTLRP